MKVVYDEHNFQAKTKKQVQQSLFWIRIHLIQIRIQNFSLNTDPDPIRIQGFDDQKLNCF
jgi:hypothetical protein